MALKQLIFISLLILLEAEKSKIKVPLGWVCCGTNFPHLQPCLLVTFHQGRGKGAFLGFFYKGLIPSMRLHHHGPPPNTISWGVRISTGILEGHKQSDHSTLSTRLLSFMHNAFPYIVLSFVQKEKKKLIEKMA